MFGFAGLSEGRAGGWRWERMGLEGGAVVDARAAHGFGEERWGGRRGSAVELLYWLEMRLLESWILFSVC